MRTNFIMPPIHRQHQTRLCEKRAGPAQAQTVRVDDFVEVCYTLAHNNGIDIYIRCGRGSVGRTSPCQGEGRGFESHRPLFYWIESISATWPSGKARVCKTLITGSNPVVASMNEPDRLVFVPGGIPSRYDKARVCKTLITGSNPHPGAVSRRRLYE
jgi:hypothetical protein